MSYVSSAYEFNITKAHVSSIRLSGVEAKLNGPSKQYLAGGREPVGITACGLHPCVHVPRVCLTLLSVRDARGAASSLSCLC